MVRPAWDEYFMNITKIVATRATCDRGKSGCVIAKNNRIVSTGYVGSPPGMPHCDDVGHLFKKVIDEDGHESNHCLRTVHAEQNAISQAAKFGTPVDGATVYTSMEPCSSCAKMLLSAGVKRVVCEKHYHAAQETRDMFKQAGVELVVLNDETAKYEKQ